VSNAPSELAPIRIGVDLTPLLPGSENGGAKFATLQFIESLLNDFANQVRLTLFVPEIVFEELANRFSGRADLVRTRRGRRNPLLAAVEEVKSQIRIRSICCQNSIQLFYSPFGRFLSLPLDIPFVAQVHDLLHLDYPQTLTERDRLWRHLNLLKLSERKAVFQVSSEFTRERLHSAYSIPLERIHRTYLPIHGRLLSDNVYREKAYFFYPARAWPHKNHENLLLGYKAYRERLTGGAWDLVLTADVRDPVDKLRSMVLELGLIDHVQFLGQIDEDHLGRVYQEASALVFPSRYEGFGIPLIEAMYFGLPIICGRGGSQPEVAGEAAIYVDVEDPRDIAQAMVKLTEESIVRQELIAHGKRQLQKFVLRTELEKLLGVFRKCGTGEIRSKIVARVQSHLTIFFFVLLDAFSAAYFLGLDCFRRVRERQGY
jgi:glycosyltransferase involved in cell wall biosynthesis